MPRRCPLTFIAGILQRMVQAAPPAVARAVFAVALAGAWLATRFSPAARARFNGLRVGVREALYCTEQRVEDDRQWCRLLEEAGFLDVRLVKRFNIWGHQGMYCGRKP